MKYYCSTCDSPSEDETCRDCGAVADEICQRCSEWIENCDCPTPIWDGKSVAGGTFERAE